MTATLLHRVFAELETRGVLLESDARAPNVAALVAGRPVRGSWWAHPKSHAIWAVLQHVAAHDDVIGTKLLSGKVTFVHRSFWPALLAVATSGERWQTEALSRPARALLDEVIEAGRVRTDHLPPARRTRIGDAARELEHRLLVYSEQVHTAKGAHAKVLESWDHWRRRLGLPTPDVSPAEARRRLEACVEGLNLTFGAGLRAPWQARARRRKPSISPP